MLFHAKFSSKMGSNPFLPNGTIELPNLFVPPYGGGMEIMMNSLFLLTGDAGGSILMIVFTVLIFVAMYFFMLRPQKKQEKEAAKMRDELTVGDEITTIGGIIGKVVSIKDETLVLETTKDRTRIRILKSAVSRVDVKAEDAQD